MRGGEPSAARPLSECDLSFELAALRVYAFRYPLATPVRTSFGVMQDRPAVIIEVENRDGICGWGEIWCNFPTVGAEYRARLATMLGNDLLIGHRYDSPGAVFRDLTDRTAVLAIQCGDDGSLAQTIAGIDVALWDMAARRANLPLWKLLGGAPHIGIYASGIGPDKVGETVASAYLGGFRAFKFKVGFGQTRDRANLEEAFAAARDCPVMADANQGWNVAEAMAMKEILCSRKLTWLEEPIRADESERSWQTVARELTIPLAAGENIRKESGFQEMLRQGNVAVIQPDIGKWGGFTGCLGVGRSVRRQGYRFCPHWLGGGVGLVAAMHLLAAVGGDGLMEVDVNENPLRDGLMPWADWMRDGAVALPPGSGLGAVPDLDKMRAWRIIL
ncbi:MAG TPA: mandelate racemase/muconate lactonizing enzyme family protein [Burkholderiales bacterium]|nr:mandelate racemase/muconate lactonizing enzyme family protein [Burkholderiales bacterium]